LVEDGEAVVGEASGRHGVMEEGFGRSIKDGKYRRILPEWVDDYIADRVKAQRIAS
jgi:hypothetical protein